MGNAGDNPLICPECDYNLTGLPEDRCPECGTPFDREELERIAAGKAAPLIADWDSDNPLPSCARVWWRAAFTPSDFARRFPPRHNENAALGYSALCYSIGAALAVGAAFVLMAINPSGKDMAFELGFAMAVSAGTAIACCVCEVVIALLLAFTVRPKRARERYHFWRGLTHCTSGFIVLTACCLTGSIVAASVEQSPYFPDGPVSVVCSLAGFVSFAWWVAALNAMIRCRAAPGLARTCMECMIPIVGLGSAALAVFLSALFAVICVFGG